MCVSVHGEGKNKRQRGIWAVTGSSSGEEKEEEGGRLTKLLCGGARVCRLRAKGTDDDESSALSFEGARM